MKRLTNCQSWAVPPFSFNEELKIIVDPELYKNEEIIFNAGRLDRSIYILSKDYKQILLNEYPNSIDFPISTTE